MKRRALQLAAAAALLCAGAAVLLLLYRQGMGVPCLLRLLTGLECPGCGGTRMLAALLAGRPTEAWHSNPGLFTAAPLALFALGSAALRWLRTGSQHFARWERTLLLCCCGGLLIFGVLRNF